MTDPLSETIESAWRHLTGAHHAVQTAIEQSLKRDGFPPLAWYDCLTALHRSTTGTLRPLELERSLLLPQYGMSRLLTRIEGAGYIRREKDRSDGRAQIIAITDEGRVLRAAMEPVYAAALHAALGDKVGEKQARKLAKTLKKVMP